jgi:hypothetical protein
MGDGISRAQSGFESCEVPFESVAVAAGYPVASTFHVLARDRDAGRRTPPREDHEQGPGVCAW